MYTYSWVLAYPVFWHILLPLAKEQDLPLKLRLV